MAVFDQERGSRCVSRSVAMKVTGPQTESVYNRYAIVSEADLSKGLAKLARLDGQDSTPTVVPFKVAKWRPADSGLAQGKAGLAPRLFSVRRRGPPDGTVQY